MTTYNFASAFSALTIADSFNPAIVRDAGNGGVSTILVQALESQYGFVLAVTPRTAIGQINKFIGTDKAPAKKDNWTHGKPAAIAVAQALHALGVALHECGKVKGLAMLAPLSAWCDPVAIEAVRVAKEAAKVVTDAAKAAETLRLDTVLSVAQSEAEGDSVPEADSVPDSVPADTVAVTLDNAPFEVMTPDNGALTANIIATIKSGVLSADNMDDILAAIMAMADSALV